VASSSPRRRILFVAPAYWPAVAFGGPIPVLRELAAGLTARGHRVDVLTTSLTDVGRGASVHTRQTVVDGAFVNYLATPLTYRWMGVTPSLPLRLRALGRPDVVHVFGLRDPVGTGTALWARMRGIPYVFEALGMFGPKLRKVRLKRVLDARLLRWLPAHAEAAIACSAIERDEYLAGGVDPDRIVIRPNGFPAPYRGPRTGALRRRLGIDAAAPLVLYVGRVAGGKGIEFLLDAARMLPDVHVAIVGPDDRHGLGAWIAARRSADGTAERVHVVGPWPGGVPAEVYADADVFALPSRHESFGMAAAEAAAAGVPVVVSDRCGAAELLGEAAVVVPYDASAVRAAIGRLLRDPEERLRRSAAGAAVAERHSWARVVELQEELYDRALDGRA
jgi:glycosyltransferase involved in cell wall biosynthesis